MHDSALDYIIFILILVIVSAITFNLVLPVAAESKNMYESETYDKTVGQPNGESALSYESIDKSIQDSCMTYDKLAVMIANQDSFIPNINKAITPDDTVYINIGDNAIAVGNSKSNANISDIIGNIQDWFTLFKGSSSYGKLYNAPNTYKDALYQVKYSSISTGAKDSKGNKIAPCYAMFILATTKADYQSAQGTEVYGKLYRCMSDGTITDMEGNVV